ncbi:hypothetical protein HPP92_022881 [Vanilla planifolia]|uniref:Uncharacterized protein n=1 Tax=Vanilla planifolia TaxID=51239 RepID=A0A835PZ47_VANPL|nr:hypothetical protein HPP92_022881 [Vanilla planifolia]
MLPQLEKNMSSIIEPENLEAIICSLTCKHSRLVERPLELAWKRGVISQKISTTGGLALISESDWKFFCEEWNAQESKGIHAKIAFANNTTNKVPGSSQEVPVVDEELDQIKEEKYCQLEERAPFIITDPEICEVCIGERESSELVQKLNYSDEDICVYLVHGKEAPRSIIEPSNAPGVPNVQENITRQFDEFQSFWYHICIPVENDDMGSLWGCEGESEAL